MLIRGIRGATTAEENDADAILVATRALLEAMAATNAVRNEDLAAVYFTVTPDLDAAFPATAARQLGWQHVPLLDACEIPVPGSLARCIRVLFLWNTERGQEEIVHVYQGEAVRLRPDLARKEVM